VPGCVRRANPTPLASSIDPGLRCAVKWIVVTPGTGPSLRMYHHRAENWVVITGMAEVLKGDWVTTLTENRGS
jgi:mannose-1-phosphate guanylyltransferase/mannose-6-phosphate isomerase